MIVARPRFTLRWVMIAFTVLGVAFYFLFVRPTALANQFVRDIQSGNFTQAESLLGEQCKNPFGKSVTFREFTTVASVYPRDWSDVWHFRRTIEVSAFRFVSEPPQQTSNIAPAIGMPRPTARLNGSAAYQSGPFGIHLIRNDIRPIDRY